MKETPTLAHNIPSIAEVRKLMGQAKAKETQKFYVELTNRAVCAILETAEAGGDNASIAADTTSNTRIMAFKKLANDLETEGYKVVFHWYDGCHELSHIVISWK
ncbi:MAG: hypothetical protein E7270_01845 [Lachnospiraceae bacterium]|nr:hypothetical protein [Lachnospiraceae bacterium]